MTASTASTRTGVGRKATMLLLGAMIACLGVFAFSGPAKAAPTSMTLTDGQLNLGFAFKGAPILPAPSHLGADPDAVPPVVGTPLPDLWDARDTTDTTNPFSALPYGCLTPALLNITVIPPTPVGANPEAPCNGNPASASVDGDLTGQALTIPGSADGGLGAVPGTDPPTSWGLPSGFRFPIMVVPNPLDGSPVPVSIASTGPLTGSYDSGTGDVSLAGPIEARVLVGLASNPLGQYCALPLVGLTLSTTSNADFPGVPFTSGLSGDGALTGTYNITDDATSVGSADCGTVNSVSKGAGSIWVSHNIATPPVCDEYTTGIPPNCVPDPCPSGYSGVQPNCKKLKGKITSVKVSGPKKVKKGKKVKYTVKIKNGGKATATQVRLKVSGRGISFNTSVGKISKGQTKTVKLKVKFKKPGKVKATFKVNSKDAGGKTVKKTIKVKK